MAQPATQTIRLARLSDAEPIAGLLDELGYPTSGDQVAGVESAAREADCFRLEVTTHPERTVALAFYEAAGFTRRPHRLIKKLAP
jgi:hypothetical protein